MNLLHQSIRKHLYLIFFLPSILRLKLPQSNVFKQEDYKAQRFPNNTVKVYSMLTFLFPSSLSDNLY